MSKIIKHNKTKLFYQTRVVTDFSLPSFKFSKNKKFKGIYGNVQDFLNDRNKVTFFQTKLESFTSKKWGAHRFSRKVLNFTPFFFFRRRFSLLRIFKSSLKAKQLLKTNKMIINENQLQNLIRSTKGQNLRLIKILQKIEHRIDIILFRMGITVNSYWLRQAITFGLVFINGAKTTKPSFNVKPLDIISINPNWKSLIFLEIFQKGIVIDNDLKHILINHNNISSIIIDYFNELSLPFPQRKLDLYFLYLLERR